MTQAIFLSYASQDADAARRICEALRAAGLEVWFDQSELRGGDAWDASIRRQIRDCALFVPLISANTNAREEGYFRLEWKLAVDRSHLMAENKAFFLPVILDETAGATANVPEVFRTRQWTRIATEGHAREFAERVVKVLAGSGASGKSGQNGASNNEFGAQGDPSSSRHSGGSRNPATLEPLSTTLDSRLRENDESVGSPRKSTKWIAIASAALAIAAALWFAFNKSNRSHAIDSIAILPFHTPIADADTDYLSEGLAETMIYQLSQVPQFKVSPASSVRRYKGKDIDPLKVGKELQVGAVMAGRLLQRGEGLTISVELIDVRNNKALWGEKYERKMSDLLAMQREISAEISRKLQLRLTGGGERTLQKNFTGNNEAYQLYLKGQYQYGKRGKESLARAVEFFQQAVKLDPNFAMAHVALANTYSIAAFNMNTPAGEALPLAAAAAERALAIDPALADAHAAKASIAAMDWRWEDAKRGFARALELNPDVAETQFRYGLVYLIPMNRFDEAIAAMRRATELEPQDMLYAAVLTRAYLAAGKTREALDHVKKIHALDPEHVITMEWHMIASIAASQGAEALELIAKIRSKGNPRAGAGFAVMAYLSAGKPEDAQREWRSTLDATASRPSDYYLALIAGAMGDRDHAFELFEHAFASRNPRLMYLQSDSIMYSLPLRDDPRFASLAKRVGLPR